MCENDPKDTFLLFLVNGPVGQEESQDYWHQVRVV